MTPGSWRSTLTWTTTRGSSTPSTSSGMRLPGATLTRTTSTRFWSSSKTSTPATGLPEGCATFARVMKQSVYIAWAKSHAAARYNLANSGLLGCEAEDLPLAPEDVVLNGPNADGYAPLAEAIAAQYGVAPGGVV